MSASETQIPWQQFKLQLRKTWRQLTDADLEAISTGRADLVDIVQRLDGLPAMRETQSPESMSQELAGAPRKRQVMQRRSVYN